MGVLDIILGRDEQGNSSKINMALIALLLWRWYQSSGQGGGAQPSPEPIPAPGPKGQTRFPRDEPAHIPAPVPTPNTPQESDKDFGPLAESAKNMPDGARRGGTRRRGRDDDEEMEEDGGMEGRGGGMGGGLGDILGDILRGGGRGAPGGGRSPGGGGLGDILGDVLGGGRGAPGGGRGGPGGGSLGDILGDILGGGRSPTSRIAGPQGDPFSDLLRGAGGGGLGGLLAGGAAGGVLGDLLKQFDQSGKGEAARSWVSGGQNVPVTPKDIETTFGSDIINQLAEQFGMNKTELLKGLSEVMPETIDKLTPDGRLPTEDEISRWK